MYTIFLIKTLTTDPETGKEFYLCGPAEHPHHLSPANVTYYCSTATGNLIRYETYNEVIAARLTLDTGFIANREEDVPTDLLEQSRYYMWGDTEKPTSGDYATWVAAGKPVPISTIGPAQIFGPGEAAYMTIGEAKRIIREVIK
jgi:hypothetical protein